MQSEMTIDQKDDNSDEISFPDVYEAPVSWGTGDLNLADKHKAIVNPETGKVFSIVSKDYRLIRHEQAIERVEKVIAESANLGEWETEIEFHNNGGRMRMKYLFPDIKVYIGPRDPVNLELQLFNSYDTSWPFTVLLGAFRFVCMNGLVIGQKFLHLRRRHVYDFEQIDVEKVVSTALKRFDRQTKQWQEWTDRHLTQKRYESVMKTMKLGKAAGAEIEERMNRETERFDDDGFPVTTLWVFFNVLTWYITHRSVSLNHRVEMERRLRVASANFRG